MITFEVVLGLVRHILTTTGGVLAGKGIIETSQVEGLVGAILVIIGTGWSIYSKKE